MNDNAPRIRNSAISRLHAADWMSRGIAVSTIFFFSWMPAAQAAAIEADLRDELVVPKPAQPSSLPVRDPDDRWVLASAVAVGADLLVTGDTDLLAVALESPIPIVTPRECWQRLRSR